MRRAIVTYEWKRPRYLFVTLQAISRLKGIADWDIIVSIDGKDADFSIVENSLFHRVEVCQFPNHTNNITHTLRSLKLAFDHGYDEVLFFDGDMILRTDTLTYFSSLKRDAFFYSMYSGNEPPHSYNSFGNLIERSNFEKIYAYVESKEWEGKEDVQYPGRVYPVDWPNYDGVFYRYMLDHQQITRYADKCYSFHFGVNGENFHQNDALEKLMFSGAPETWLDNILTLAQKTNHTAFRPKEFSYA